MNKLFLLLAALFLMTVSLCGAEEAFQVYGEIDTKGLNAIIDSGVPVVILDTRPLKYDDGRRLPGAKYLVNNATADQIANIISSKNSLIITYCTSVRCPMSKIAAEKLVQLGYPNVIKYPPGIEGWLAEGGRYDTQSPGS